MRDPVKKAEWQKSYRAANPDKVRAEGRSNMSKRRALDPKKVMVEKARTRAKTRGTECTITCDDFDIPDVCPVLGIPLFRSEGVHSPNSPTLDEIVRGSGYTPDNVLVMSHLANACKRDLTPDQLLMLADWIYKTFGPGTDLQGVTESYDR